MALNANPTPNNPCLCNLLVTEIVQASLVVQCGSTPGSVPYVCAVSRLTLLDCVIKIVNCVCGATEWLCRLDRQVDCRLYIGLAVIGATALSRSCPRGGLATWFVAAIVPFAAPLETRGKTGSTMRIIIELLS